ncbi:hypothetical protein Q5P01_005054 [Channa striata]|uniref:Uncharacterized protein n=1 Tax=Channa striata TaxID=64152 RepID=A0AA88NC69_CHASR|nr:hypothetical protein Q5P01_005054 [Channa striata]
MRMPKTQWFLAMDNALPVLREIPSHPIIRMRKAPWSLRMKENPRSLPIQCVDNAEGYPAVVVFDDETYPISSPQDAIDPVVSDNRQCSSR